ncbi:MAG: 50S ribosomal protein L11 methyltransferase [Holophagaceae bacterium]
METSSVPDDASVHAPAPWRPDTRVRLASRVSLDLAGTVVRLEARGGSHAFPRSVLTLLAFFETPHTLQEGLDWLAGQAKGTAGLAEAFGALLRLGELGVLEGEDGARPGMAGDPDTGFGPAAQIRMLEDRTRTSMFIEAIRRTVKPGDVVLDLGTGTGILALAAAQAGARHVYAIEARPIAETAARLFASSGLGDRITLLRGLSLDLDLPERADVMVSEILGHDPFGEGLVESAVDALARLLKPGARLIPGSLGLHLSPLEVPGAFLRRHRFTRAAARRWSRWYGLELGALAEIAGDAISLLPAFVAPAEARRWPRLGPPAPLWECRLADLPGPRLGRAEVRLEAPPRRLGLLLHWEASLTEGVVLSTALEAVSPDNHWRSRLWLVEGWKGSPGGRLCLEARVSRRRLDLSAGA